MSSNLAWLKGQCNRYTSGRCTIRACFVRGGWDGVTKPIPNYELSARCEAFEVCEALEVAIELAKSVTGGRISEHPKTLAERILANAVADRLALPPFKTLNKFSL